MLPAKDKSLATLQPQLSHSRMAAQVQVTVHGLPTACCPRPAAPFLYPQSNPMQPTWCWGPRGMFKCSSDNQLHSLRGHMAAQAQVRRHPAHCQAASQAEGWVLACQPRYQAVVLGPLGQGGRLGALQCCRSLRSLGSHGFIPAKGKCCYQWGL